jgi:hypothetical protein
VLVYLSPSATGLAFLTHGFVLGALWWVVAAHGRHSERSTGLETTTVPEESRVKP